MVTPITPQEYRSKLTKEEPEPPSPAEVAAEFAYSHRQPRRLSVEWLLRICQPSAAKRSTVLGECRIDRLGDRTAMLVRSRAEPECSDGEVAFEESADVLGDGGRPTGVAIEINEDDIGAEDRPAVLVATSVDGK